MDIHALSRAQRLHRARGVVRPATVLALACALALTAACGEESQLSVTWATEPPPAQIAGERHRYAVDVGASDGCDDVEVQSLTFVACAFAGTIEPCADDDPSLRRSEELIGTGGLFALDWDLPPGLWTVHASVRGSACGSSSTVVARLDAPVEVRGVGFVDELPSIVSVGEHRLRWTTRPAASSSTLSWCDADGTCVDSDGVEVDTGTFEGVFAPSAPGSYDVSLSAVIDGATSTHAYVFTVE